MKNTIHKLIIKTFVTLSFISVAFVVYASINLINKLFI